MTRRTIRHNESRIPGSGSDHVYASAFRLKCLRCRNRFRQFMYRIVDTLSFSAGIRDLVDMLNRKAARADELAPALNSHPGGFVRAFGKRRMGIAESYMRIALNLDRNSMADRLNALKILMELSFHAKTVGMPLNTARVQIEFMKEAVKHVHNRRRQMELVADFSVASYGHEAAIRKYLRELKRVEVPELGRPLKNLGMGWDSHVHDNLSTGRKTPSQLILDAFIKGVSSLTLAYFDFPDREVIFEAVEAGRILGIDVTLGIEFSVGPRFHRRHFLFIAPANDYASFLNYFNQNCKVLSTFVDGLDEIRSRRQAIITEVLEHYNRTHRVIINEGYSEDSIFALPRLRFEDLDRLAPHGQYARNHLGELIFEKMKECYRKRVLALKVQHSVAVQLYRERKMSGWEVERITVSYENAREAYTGLSPAEIKSRYLTGKAIVDYDSPFPSEDEVIPELKAAGGRIVFHRPLENGLSAAAETVIRNHAWIDGIEVINMRDSLRRDPAEITWLARFIHLLNTGETDELKQFMEDRHVTGVNGRTLERAVEKYQQTPLIPLAGSGTTGWMPEAPGMGFIREKSIPKKSFRHFSGTHYRLPRPVSDVLTGGGRFPDKEDEIQEIYCMGKTGQFKRNPVGDETSVETVSPSRVWRYMNPGLKNFIRAFIGFIPAYLWVGYGYALIWFGITFFRNVIVDLVAHSGARPQAWSIKDINFDNASQSLFWTGFSVPVLSSVKIGFDLFWPLAPAGPVFEWTKFFFICIANGIYISIHNKIRRFDSGVIRGNFFRSILAWPFSAVFAPVGNMLLIPSIVQAKFWSDAVAAVIEGSGKFAQKVVLRQRDLREILPCLESDDREIRLTAMLDILYIWAKRQRGQTALARILLNRGGAWESFRRGFRKRRAGNNTAGRETGLLMLQHFNCHKAQIELSHFILRRYSDHRAVILTELLNSHLVSFNDWLKKLKKKLGKQAEGSPVKNGEA